MEGWSIKDTARKYICPFCILMAIYTIGILAIIRADFYYIDDIGRTFWGYRRFQYFSRYVAEFGSILVHGDYHLTDISPIPQILAAGVMAISGVVLLHVITDKERFSWIEYIAMVPLCLSPYFLECMSYKFDAPYMAISVLVSVAPVLFYKNGTAKYLLSVVLGTLIMCMSYQASSGIFPMLIVLLASKKWSQRVSMKEVGRFILLSAIGYLVGVLFFAGVIMRPTIQGDYVSTSIPAIRELPYYFAHNLKEYYYTVATDLKPEWLVLIGVLFLGFLYVFVWESKQKWYFSLPAAGVGVLVMLLLTFGMYPALETPLFAPRAMYGFGVMVCMIGIYAVSAIGRKEYVVAKAACLVLCWCFFTFAFTYGNTLNVQKTYTDYRIATVIDDLDEAGVFDSEETKTVQISGTIGYAPGIYAMRQDYQILNRLIPVMFQNSSWEWGRFGFENYYGLPKMEWASDNKMDLQEMNLPILKNSTYHTIRADSGHILIELKY